MQYNYHTVNLRDAQQTNILSQRQNKGSATGSRLKQWNLLEKGVIVSLYRKRQSDIATYYSDNGDLMYWNNIQHLMKEMQLEHMFGAMEALQ